MEILKKKRKISPRIILIILIFLILGLFGYLFISKKKPVYDFYVDSSKSSGNGTESSPFKTISEAIQAASKKDPSNRKIYVYSGKYKESIIIYENTEIYGQDRKTTIIKGADPYGKDISAQTPGVQFLPTITMKNNSSLNNLTISGGNPGIMAERNANIENCIVKNTGIEGINALPGDFLINLKNIEVLENNQKGIFIQKGRRFLIDGSYSHHNGGEGIDLRENISGIISNNAIYSNEESGIELHVGSSSVTIIDNKIIGNRQDGLQAQYCSWPSCDNPEALKIGKIKLIDNEISYNGDNGIKCTNPSGSPLKEYYSEESWKKSITMKNNNFFANKKSFDSRCKLKDFDNKIESAIWRSLLGLFE